ncbi:hypothetical protein [Pontibacter oryzae]|uniref:hypothetical protein n=1 Tax=Pontibacter oryzae TaxID=2304593 RepID=UPI0018F2951B|nr:hypothetical protein [Pontibacter oryzae]
MKKRILHYLKHLSLTILVLAAIAIPFGLYHGASLSYGDNPERLNLDREGPYAFYKNDSTLTVKYVRGNKDDGFYIDQKDYPAQTLLQPLASSR